MTPDLGRFASEVKGARAPDIPADLMARLLKQGCRPTLAYRLGRGDFDLIPKAA